MNKLLLVSFFSIMLVGCKVDVVSDVNLQDVLSDKPKEVASNLVVEVTSCNDYKDSRKESSALLQAKQAVASIFKNAKYIECYSEKMNSKAIFNIPITVGGKEKAGDIQINADNEGVIAIQTSDELIEKLNNAKQKSYINVIPTISFNLNNDSGHNVDFNFFGVFANDLGYSYLVGEIENNIVPNIRLSNASMDQLLRDKFVIVGPVSIKK